MALIRNLFWTAIFLAATFAFTVLFEHGPTDFIPNAKKEFETLKAMASTKPLEKKDTSDKVLPPLPR
ncbi:MAG: hypothetical protein ABJF10_18650 [Chthoniobacter sp.]|uniref:hypothetical protein n=1 Tax=Chthoniobacter sp. TaxID=2510640 RepID=UPI0032ACC14D